MDSSGIYGLLRHLPTQDVALQTIYSDYEPIAPTSDSIITAITADRNVDYLTKMIIDKMDPLRNGSFIGSGRSATIKQSVKDYLDSWIRMGKFDKHMGTSSNKSVVLKQVNIISSVDSYNKEFVDAFAHVILPITDPTNVTSVVNPNGMYAQQERVLITNSKPTPFYERALYRRLNDWNMDLGMDETEAPFYKMDHNPRLSVEERKKTNATQERESHLDRENLAFRMKPKY